jgi:F-box and WD-40 domain protein 1/11
MVWSLKTGRLLGTFVGAHTGSVLCLKFERDWDLDDSNSSTTRREISYDKTSSLWTDVDTEIDSNGTISKRPSKTGFMFTGSSDCTICVWSLDTGDLLREGMGAESGADTDRRVLAEPVSVLKGHTGGVLDLRIDKRWIVSW